MPLPAIEASVFGIAWIGAPPGGREGRVELVERLVVGLDHDEVRFLAGREQRVLRCFEAAAGEAALALCWLAAKASAASSARTLAASASRAPARARICVLGCANLFIGQRLRTETGASCRSCALNARKRETL